MGLVLFDFAGSGYSEGDYITLGINESKDTKLIIDHVKTLHPINKIILWGRSMGAVTAILFSAKEENSGFVDKIILDSPFSSFPTMIDDILRDKIKLPKCLVNGALFFVNKTIKKKTGVNLKKLKPLDLVKHCKVPAFFLVCKNDIISRPD